MTTPNDSYIVFAADQVLTSDHLNQLFNYLDKNNRLTRNKLIGAGIECGLKLAYDDTNVSISVSSGSGLTSQGYLILESVAKVYTHFTTYAAPELASANLPFLQDAYEPIDIIKKFPFYQGFVAANPDVKLLLTADESDENNGQPLTLIKDTLDKYVVVLFLEMTEKDLKNCDAFDCNNKGERMSLIIKPLLVKKDAVNIFPKPWNTAGKEVELKRYNVPFTTIQTAQEVLDNFIKITEKDPYLLPNLDAGFNHCSEIYTYFTGDNNSAMVNRLGTPGALEAGLHSLYTWININNPLLIQYYYDHINDLALAYYEFVAKAKELVSVCCFDENAFPLHLILGIANTTTGNLHNDKNRQHFIYTPLYCRQTAGVDALRLMYERIDLMVLNFAAWVKNVTTGDAEIKITPSQYEDFSLSERCIPYYYFDPKQQAGDIYPKWNFHKTRYGNERFNLSYNAPGYNNSSTVTDPLLFDIERYDFFRIEGHIGADYQTANKYLDDLRMRYNLPIDIVTIPVEMLGATNEALPPCKTQDLIIQYRLTVNEFLCSLQEYVCRFVKLKLSFAKTIIPTKKGAAAPVKTNRVLVEYDDATAIVPFGGAVYKKGDFVSANCKVKKDDGTFGGAYLATVQNGVYLHSEHTASNITGTMLDFIDAADNLFMYLQNNDLSVYTTAAFNKAYTTYSKLQVQVVDLYEKNTEAEIANDDCCCHDLHCKVEKFLLLKEEHDRRLKLYNDQLKFAAYYKKHPGLEHKAGVPKGGTFVMVYRAQEEMHIWNGANELTGKLQGLDQVFSKQPVRKNSDKSSLLAAANDLQKAIQEAGERFDETVRTFPVAEQRMVTGYFQGAVTETRQIPTGVIIADFYIPYQCCSDCEPAATLMEKQLVLGRTK